MAKQDVLILPSTPRISGGIAGDSSILAGVPFSRKIILSQPRRQLLEIFFAVTALLFISTAGYAQDRVSTVHSRIESALSNILHRSDYLVIVNRIDQLDDGGSSTAATGQVRRLPGLFVGVDATGKVIRNDEAAGQYNGGLSISVIIDPAVKQETYSLIQKNIPELAGGLRDTDEFRIARASLRQPPPPNAQAPQVAVNNNMGDSKGSSSELLRQLAVGLALLGLFIWILSRMLKSQKDSPSSSKSPARESTAEDVKEESAKERSQKHIAELDPLLTGLYLIRCQNQRQNDRIRGWVHAADPTTMRAVILALPGWISSTLEKNLRDALKDVESPRTDVSVVYMEISVLEKNLRDPKEKTRALLSWFPAMYLRDVPSHQRDMLSRESRVVLWYLRPELGDFVKLESESYDDALAEPSPEAIQICHDEMANWTSKAIIGDRSAKRDTVGSLAKMINQLREFGPIESRVKQAKERLSPEDFARLEKQVVWVRTPLSWNTSQLKDWLRLVDPQDYLWWCQILGETPSWNMSELVRPLRLSMFQNAAEDPLFKQWSEPLRKQAAERILNQIRSIHFAQDSEDEISA
jgi:hypothetical protein